ncbi:ATP-binding protein [Homoserinimonas sp. A520]
MSTTAIRPPLTRPSRSVLGGVCAGLARHLHWPVARVRFIIVVASFVMGAGVLLYAWLWALTPRDETDERQGVRREIPTSALLLGAGAIAAIVAVAVANSEGNGFIATMLAITFTGSAVAWSLTLDRDDAARTPRYLFVVRTLSVIVLLGAGILLLFSGGGRPSAVTAVLAIGMLVLGLGVIVAPFVVRLWRDLMAERAGRVREEQRAEIAAHLHDSVLQTLALIQNRAGASSEVARLARAQERELRDWLFAGTTPSGTDLVAELRDIAAAIELEHPARLDVVTVGEPGVSNPSLIAAAREAMLNAARHAGGDVSVYIESSPSTIDVFVRDRGPGVDLDSLPTDRLGVRESIIGRMLRAGGTATVKPGVGGVGTEVHLHLEVPSE